MNPGGRKMKTADLERELVRICNNPQEFDKFLEYVLPDVLAEVQNYLWEYLLNLAKESGRPLERNDIIKRMIDSRSYQRLVGCNEHAETCRAKICMIANPICAGNKLRMHINTLREMILEYKTLQEES